MKTGLEVSDSTLDRVNELFKALQLDGFALLGIVVGKLSEDGNTVSGVGLVFNPHLSPENHSIIMDGLQEALHGPVQ